MNGPTLFRGSFSYDNNILSFPKDWVVNIFSYYGTHPSAAQFEIPNTTVLNPPEEVKEETKLYKSSNDLIQNWIDDCITECDEFSTFNELFDDWEGYCDEVGIHPKQRPEKKEIKSTLMKLQDKTEYGLVIGKKNSDGAPNGTKMYPKFNFKTNEE